MSGYRAIFGHEFRYALIGDRQISSDTLIRWFWIHVALVPLLCIAGLATALVLLARPKPAALASPAEPDVDVIRERAWHSPS